MDTLERGEMVEAERDEEALWMASVRRYHERERAQTLWEKLRYHEAMMRRHTSTYEFIVGRHRLEVERCEALLGISEKGAV